MATNNYDGLFKYKQDNGDVAVLYPRTKVASVEGAATAASVTTLSNRVDAGQAVQDGRLDALEKLFTFDTISDMCNAAKNITLRVSNRTDSSNNGSVLFTPRTISESASITINNAAFDAYLPYPFSCAEKSATLGTTAADITVYASVPDDAGTKVNGYQITLSSTYLVFNTAVRWWQNESHLTGTVSVNQDGTPLHISEIPDNATVLAVVVNARFY